MNRSVCTICADYLTCENSVACPCGHTFHIQCISRWKEQSSTCPQCRKSFKSTIKLYFELSRDDRAEVDPAELRNEVTELNIKIRVRDSSIEQLQKEKDKLAAQQKSKDDEVKRIQRILDETLGSGEALRKQINYLEKFKKESQRAKDELQKLQKQMSSYHNIRELVDGESYDVERTIQSFGDNPDSFNQICTSYVLLKKEFEHIKDSKRKLEMEKKTLRRKNENRTRELFECNEKLDVVTNDLKNLDDKNKSLTIKISALEKSLSATSASPKTMAIKRLINESPAPSSLKKMCVDDLMDQDSLVNNAVFSIKPQYSLDLDLDKEESLKIADEFGLNLVATTSMTAEKKFNDLNRKAKSFGMKKNSLVANKKEATQGSDLPHFRKGFNGMGGHTKTLVIPKKMGTLVKQNNTKAFKIPRNNNAKITNFMSSDPKLPMIELSP